VYTFVKQLVQPFTLSVLLLGVTLLLVRRRPGGKGRLTAAAAACYAALFLSAWGPVCHLALGALEWQFEPLAAAPTDAPALVVLGAGEASVARCVEAARLYRPDVHTTVLLCGGSDRPDVPPDAQEMRRYVAALGINPDAVVLDVDSLSTHENAARGAKLLHGRGITRAVLVTDAAHMPRAAGCFRKQGIDVVPAPCNRMIRPVDNWPAFLLPNAWTAEKIQYAVREWLGLLWYTAHGRL
jgi:uncharacterized SAM-binding protein YcdF (DUF218 family)